MRLPPEASAGVARDLIELGADPLATDGAGHTAAAYAHDPHTDRAAMEAIRPRNQIASLALHEFQALPDEGGALHLMARRGDATAVKWLLDHGADTSLRDTEHDSAPPAGRCTSVSRRPRHCSGGGRSRRPIRHVYGCVVDRVNVSVLLYVPVRSASLALTRWLNPSVS